MLDPAITRNKAITSVDLRSKAEAGPDGRPHYRCPRCRLVGPIVTGLIDGEVRSRVTGCRCWRHE